MTKILVSQDMSNDRISQMAHLLDPTLNTKGLQSNNNAQNNYQKLIIKNNFKTFCVPILILTSFF